MCHTGGYLDCRTYWRTWWYLFCRMRRPWRNSVRHVCMRCRIRASVTHQRESLTGASVEADRRDSLLFHFISFFHLFLFFVRTRRTDDAGVRGRVDWEKERDREEGLLLGPVGDEGERDAAGRNRSMSRLHERTRTESTVRRRETGRKRPRGRETA